ncbi:hypothetical protein B0H14DRAFT_3453281 [Mycena olivaceomarginata]|nr:hypothetical protein B0H14DRAFT_3453281 [Mycena olivaceomarginata]
MSDHPTQRKPNFLDKVKDEARKATSKIKGLHIHTPKHSPAPSPPRSRSTTPAPSKTQGSSPGAATNPESAAGRVDNGEDALKGADTAQTNLIPEGPFPVKSLVTIVLSAVKLGIKVSKIRREVFKFALETIKDIRDIIKASGDSQTAKENLEGICAIVNNICEWANELVQENVLERAFHINELKDWSSKLKEAKDKLMARTVLTTGRTLETMNDKNHIKEELNYIKEKLAGHVAPEHTSTDQKKITCAEHTRVKIQEEIMEWLSPQHSTDKRILWITGIAGSGKSTLSATIVDNLRKNHTPVAAQFFISRNFLKTIDPDKVIPTIAKQLAEFCPAAACVIKGILEDGFPATRKEQVEALLLAPIQEICKSHDRVVILIDALDELNEAYDNVMELLSPIAKAGRDLPDNVRFLITSRPEHWADISSSSRSEPVDIAVFKWHDLATKSSVEEVRTFIVAKMRDIIRRRQPKWDHGWPTDEDFSMLSIKADGLFHYAATALQWIDEQIRMHGTAAKEQVFVKVTQLGLRQLEDLYELILTTFVGKDDAGRDPDQLANQLRGFHQVIGTILVLRKPLTIHQIIALLADVSGHHFDVRNFLEQFRSVLIPDMTISFEEATPPDAQIFP